MEAQSPADLATKRDLMELEMRLRTDLASGKYEIIKWVAGMPLLHAGLVAALVKGVVQLSPLVKGGVYTPPAK